MRHHPSPPPRHPVNVLHEQQSPLGARVADRVTRLLGSWTFIGVQTILVTIWVVGNLYLFFHFDSYPFILLNLAFSTQAAYTAPLILLAGNRASHRDRLTLEHAAAQTDIEDHQNREILGQNERLLKGNEMILKRLTALEEALRALKSGPTSWRNQ